MDEIIRLINRIRSIKTADIIKEYENTLKLTKLIKKDKKNKGKLEILLSLDHPSFDNKIFFTEPYRYIEYIPRECSAVLDILYKYKHITKLYKIFVELFNNNCSDYSTLYLYFFENSRYKIMYNKINITRKYVNDFRFLRNYRQFYRNFVYNF